MKDKLNHLARFLRENFFIIFAAASLILPDLALRKLISPKIFSEAFVTPFTYVFTGLWVLFILLLCVFILPKRSGRIVYIITACTFIILSFSQYIYFKIFDQFFWIKSVALVGESADYLGYAIKYLDSRLITFTILSVLSLIIGSVFWTSHKLNSNFRFLLLFVPIFGLSGLHIWMQPQFHGDSQDDWDSWRKPRVVYAQLSDINKSFEVNGLLHLTFRDLYNTLLAPSDYGKKDFKEVDEYFSAKAKPQKNSYTGIFEGKNVIAVMLEGVDTWMINKKYTPTLCYMMDNGINFSNYYAPTFGTGHTFNAEFAFNTGYYTPISAVSAVNFSANSYPQSMAHKFKEAGYTLNSYHFNDSEFYNRGIMHKSFGYERYNEFADFGMPKSVGQSDSNILKNQEIYEHMVANTPFFNFIITYSPHVPYTFDDAKMLVAKGNHPELIDSSMNKEKNNCLILAADTDDFFRMLLEKLEADNLLDDTVLLVYTDHYAYGFSDQTLLAEYKNNEIMYRVPAFIYSKGITPEKIDKPMMTIDWLPTVLNLFNLDNTGEYIGGDILDPQNEGFVYFGNSAWLHNGTYFVPGVSQVPEDKREYIESQSKRVRESLRINDVVISGDYYRNR